jgi:hypothetical protein
MSTAESPSRESIARIDELVRRTESLPDPAARAVAVELVQAVMEFHAAALSRMLEIAGSETAHALASDDLISSVLALHDLHPDDFETRVRRAIGKLELHFDSRGAGIRLIELSPDAVRVRFTGSRPGSGPAAKQLIEDVIYESAPDIRSLVIEGVEERRDSGFVPLSDLVAAQRL